MEPIPNIRNGPFMRYFTRAWATGGLDDDEWDARRVAYSAHRKRLVEMAPAGVVALELGSGFCGFHDAHLLAAEDTESAVLRFSTGDLQCGYHEVVVSFSNSRIQTAGVELATLIAEPEYELLYDEVDQDGSAWVWRSLWWPLGELEIAFDEVAIAHSPRPGR